MTITTQLINYHANGTITTFALSEFLACNRVSKRANRLIEHFVFVKLLELLIRRFNNGIVRK